MGTRDRSATLAEIAQAADVGRTTLHRYFPDRGTLLYSYDLAGNVEVFRRATTA